jgi:hypothetical protein
MCIFLTGRLLFTPSINLMFSDKLVRLVAEIPFSEWKRIRDYLSSPFFNTNGDYLALFKVITSFIDRDVGEASEPVLPPKEKIWRKLFGSSRFDDEKLRRISSGLTQHIMHFLALREFERNPFAEAVYTAYAVNHPHLRKHFRGVVRQADKLFEKEDLRNANYHLHRFLLESQNHRHLEMRQDKENDLSHLVNADFHLDCYYISRKLQHLCDVLGYSSSLDKSIELPQIPGLLEYLPGSHYMKEPSVQAYFLTAQMLRQPDETSYYQAVRDYLNAHLHEFSEEEQNAFYTHLINYCIDARINKGFTGFFEELFSLYQTTIREGVLIEKGMMPINHFKNIITVGLKVRAFEWVEWFIETYTPLLPEAERDDALSFNLAKVAFEQKDYQRVITLLQEVEYRNLVYALGGKLILLRTYFEMGEYLPLDSLVDSFRNYLRRNTMISNDLKRQYLNLLRFIKRLTTVTPRDAKALGRLEKQIRECRNLVARQWLLSKAAELQ